MMLIQLTGLSGAGKTTLAFATQKQLVNMGFKVEVLDGDEYRQHLCRDLGFSRADRIENIRRLGFVGLTLAKHGVIGILAAINPYDEARQWLRNQSPLVKTVALACPLEVLIERDIKGLYKRALLEAGHPDRIENFSGISDPYEIPGAPDLLLHTHEESIEACVEKLCLFILSMTGSPPTATGLHRPPAESSGPAHIPLLQ